MKLTLARYLVENENSAPNLGVIAKNLESCINQRSFVFRGSDTPGSFGEKEARESRNSLTSSNIVMNFSSLYFHHLPSRKKSYFGTNSPSNASDFGSIFVIVPHDSVTHVAIVPNDFNLQKNPVLGEIKSDWNLSNFGVVIYSGIKILAAEANSKQAKRLSDLVSHISTSTDVTQHDFEEFDVAFEEFFRSGQPQAILEYEDSYDAKIVSFVWEQVSGKYGSKFSKFLKAAISAGQEGVEVLPFEEALKKMGTEEVYEIWFEGKCSFFSLNWLNEKYGELQEDEDADIVSDANDEQDIHDAVAEVFTSLLQK